jgi:Family of unknown function (DUF6508)
MTGEALNEARVEELLSFLPFFEESKGKNIVKWRGGERREDGSHTMPFPDYPEEVYRFFRAAAKPWWCDPNYLAAKPRELLNAGLEGADMDKAKSVLTFCCRGERFCDGFWEGLIESGDLVIVLKKIRELWLSGIHPKGE